MLDEDIEAYLPDHIRPFAQQLKQFPTEYEKWVYAPSLPADIYQGDLFARVPFVALDDEGDVIRRESQGMLVSNTCDAQPGQGEFVLVAPVIDLEDYREHNELQGEALENHIRALTENKISQLMYLPETQQTRGAFVDFGNITSASLRFFHSQRGPIRLASLSQCGHYFLLIKLAYHLCRPEPPNNGRA
jgi:hypothetical protein